MIILLKSSDKSLVVTQQTRLYQKEKCVDKVTFYIPETYQDVDLSKFNATLYYTTATNDTYTEILTSEESDKEGFLMYKLPVDTKFTSSAGDLVIELSLTYLDEDAGIQYVLHSSQLTISIETWTDFYAFYPDESLSAIDAKILQLQNETEKLKSIADELELTVPDDLKLDEDILHLSKNGALMGDGVEILTPGDPDDEDDAHDGVIDLDELKFVEL